MLRHFLDQDDFSWSDGEMLGGETRGEGFKIGVVLRSEEDETAGEAVAEVVSGDSALPGSVLGPVECCEFA